MSNIMEFNLDELNNMETDELINNPFIRKMMAVSLHYRVQGYQEGCTQCDYNYSTDDTLEYMKMICKHDDIIKMVFRQVEDGFALFNDNKDIFEIRDNIYKITYEDNDTNKNTIKYFNYEEDAREYYDELVENTSGEWISVKFHSTEEYDDDDTEWSIEEETYHSVEDVTQIS